MTLDYYGGPPSITRQAAQTQLNLDFFSNLPRGTRDDVGNRSCKRHFFVRCGPTSNHWRSDDDSHSVRIVSPAGLLNLGAVSTLQLTFNFASAGFLTLDRIIVPMRVGAVPEPAAVTVWLVLGLCGMGLAKFAQGKLKGISQS